MRTYKYYRDNQLIGVISIDDYPTAERIGELLAADNIADCTRNSSWDDFFSHNLSDTADPLLNPAKP